MFASHSNKITFSNLKKIHCIVGGKDINLSSMIEHEISLVVIKHDLLVECLDV